MRVVVDASRFRLRICAYAPWGLRVDKSITTQSSFLPTLGFLILPLFPTYVPEAQVAQVEHWELDAPEHPPLLYLPVAQVAQTAHE